MAIEIVPYLQVHEAAVRRLNQRLLAGGVDPEMQFPETCAPGWLPGMELRVAVEGDEVRGGYILRHQQFSFAGEMRSAAHCRLPLSEGQVNRAYAALALRLVRDALSHEPRLYALGMGGWDKPLPQMLKRLGWRMPEVPFYFKVPHPARFLRQIRALRSSRVRRLVCNAAALTGVGWLALWVAGLARRVNAAPPQDIAAGWIDAVWKACRADYALMAARDGAAFDALYPPSDARFIRIRAAGGWAVLLDTAMHDHKQFGDLRVGTIVDCLAPLQGAPAVIATAARVLEDRGVDLIISNQLHHSWCAALEQAGFRKGPSNFLLALSPAFGPVQGEIYINRGDGDGPIHL